MLTVTKHRCKGCRRPVVLAESREGAARMCCPRCSAREVSCPVPTEPAKVLHVEFLAMRTCRHATDLAAFVTSLEELIETAERFIDAHDDECDCYHCRTSPDAAAQARYDVESFLWCARFCRDMASGGYTRDLDERPDEGDDSEYHRRLLMASTRRARR